MRRPDLGSPVQVLVGEQESIEAELMRIQIDRSIRLDSLTSEELDEEWKSIEYGIRLLSSKNVFQLVWRWFRG